MAELRFTFGPMKAAKSATLLIEAFNYELESGRRSVVAKLSADTRDGQMVATRAGVEPRLIDFAITPATNLLKTMREMGNLALSRLFIDEAQFLTPEQVDQLSRLVVEEGIGVEAFGLRNDYMSRLFPATKRLFELATSFRELTIPCACSDSTNAIHNVLYSNGRLVTSGEDVVFIEGAKNTYVCLCTKCRDKLFEDSSC